MQAVAMSNTVVQPSVYGVRGNALRPGEIWQSKPALQLSVRESSFGLVKRDDDLDNGDPPDLMLWGEE